MLTLILTVLSLIVGLIGAITGFQWLGRRWDQLRLRSRQKKRITAAFQPRHKYLKLDYGARIGDGGLQWFVRWHPTVIAIDDGLLGVRLHTRLDDMDPASFTDTTDPTTIQVEQIPSAHPEVVSRFLRFPQTLNQDQELTFTYLRSFRKREPRAPQDFL